MARTCLHATNKLISCIIARNQNGDSATNSLKLLITLSHYAQYSNPRVEEKKTSLKGLSLSTLEDQSSLPDNNNSKVNVYRPESVVEGTYVTTFWDFSIDTDQQI